MKRKQYTNNSIYEYGDYNRYKLKKKKHHFGKVLFLLLFMTLLFVGLAYALSKDDYDNDSYGGSKESTMDTAIDDFSYSSSDADEETDAEAYDDAEKIPDNSDKADSVIEVDKGVEYYYYDRLDYTDKYIYDRLLSGILSLEKSIDFKNTDESKVDDIISMIMADHPELFWMDGSYRKITSLAGMNVKFNYTYSAKEIEQRTKEIESVSESFLCTLSKDLSEYERIKKVFEYIIDTVEYEKCEDDQNLYSAFVLKKSVCAGYSRAAQFLLQKLGIQALMVSGQGYGQGKWDSHGWLIVRCDDNYYHMDCTFADGLAAACEEMGIKGMYGYEYLCADDDSFRSNHSWDNKELIKPICSKDDLNYYKMKGMYSVEDEGVYESMHTSVYSGENVWVWQFANSYYYRQCVESKQYLTFVSEYLHQSVSGKIMKNDEMKVVIMCYD